MVVGPRRRSDGFSALHGFFRVKEKIEQMAYIHLLPEERGAAGAIGDDLLALGLLSAFHCPVCREVCINIPYGSAFTATKGRCAMMVHFMDGGITLLEKSAYGLMDFRIKAHATGVVDGDLSGLVCRVGREFFINGMDSNFFAVLFEHPVAVGAGHKYCVDTIGVEKMLDYLKMVLKQIKIT